MAWNEGSTMYKRYIESFDCMKTGTFGVANDTDKHGQLIAEIGADPVEKAKFCAMIIASVDVVTTPEQAWELVEEKYEPYSAVLDEAKNQFPDILPEPEGP